MSVVIGITLLRVHLIMIQLRLEVNHRYTHQACAFQDISLLDTSANTKMSTKLPSFSLIFSGWKVFSFWAGQAERFPIFVVVAPQFSVLFTTHYRFFSAIFFLSIRRVDLMSLRFNDSLLSYSLYQKQEEQKLPFDMYEEDEEQRFAYSLAVARAVWTLLKTLRWANQPG